MLALSDGEVKVELIDGNFHLSRVVLLGARQESLGEEKSADPEYDRLTVVHPGEKGRKKECKAVSETVERFLRLFHVHFP